MKNVSFVMITIDRILARRTRKDAVNYVEPTIKSLLAQGFPSERNLYVYDDGSPQEYGEAIKGIHPCVQLHRFPFWSAVELHSQSTWNSNSWHTFRSLEHHLQNHEPTEWVCLIEDDIEVVRNGILGLELAMTKIPSNAWTLACYTPNIQNSRYSLRPGEMWKRIPGQYYPNNVFSLIRRDLLLRIFASPHAERWKRFGAADLAIQGYLVRNRCEPNYALRKHICQHIGDFSSVGPRPIRRTASVDVHSNFLSFVKSIYGLAF
jgi:hypothetical protein